MSSKSKDVHDDELRTYAQGASKGDAVALDHFFAEVAPSAWGLSFAKTDTITGAGRRLTEGISLALHSLASRTKLTQNPRIITLRHVAHASTSQDAPNSTPESASESQQAKRTPLTKADRVSAHSTGTEPVNLLGEAQDREALLAFVALNEFSRCVLWLHVAEDLAADDVAYILDTKSERVKDTASTASTQFRQRYLEAIPRDGLAVACLHNLDRLGAYVTGTLDQDGVAETELHLVNCASCRGIVMKITNVGTRVRAGIPPLPAWARQEVTNRWTDTKSAVPLIALPVAKRTRATPHNIAAGAIAAATLLALVGLTLSTFRDREHRLANESSSTTSVTTTENGDESPEATASSPTENTDSTHAHESAPTTTGEHTNATTPPAAEKSEAPVGHAPRSSESRQATSTSAPTTARPSTPAAKSTPRSTANGSSSRTPGQSGMSASHPSTHPSPTSSIAPSTPHYVIIETTTITETVTITETTRTARSTTREPRDKVIAGGVVSSNEG